MLRADQFTTAAEFSGPEPESKDAQEGYLVLDVRKVGDTEPETVDVWLPALIPEGVTCAVVTTADSSLGHCLSKAEVSIKLYLGIRCHTCQGVA